MRQFVTSAISYYNLRGTITKIYSSPIPIGECHTGQFEVKQETQLSRHAISVDILATIARFKGLKACMT